MYNILKTFKMLLKCNITIILSESMIVCSRWAIVMTVQSLKASLNACCIRESVLKNKTTHYVFRKADCFSLGYILSENTVYIIWNYKIQGIDLWNCFNNTTNRNNSHLLMIVLTIDLLWPLSVIYQMEAKDCLILSYIICMYFKTYIWQWSSEGSITKTCTWNVEKI